MSHDASLIGCVCGTFRHLEVGAVDLADCFGEVFGKLAGGGCLVGCAVIARVRFARLGLRPPIPAKLDTPWPSR